MRMPNTCPAPGAPRYIAAILAVAVVALAVRQGRFVGVTQRFAFLYIGRVHAGEVAARVGCRRCSFGYGLLFSTGAGDEPRGAPGRAPSQALPKKKSAIGEVVHIVLVNGWVRCVFN